MTNIDKIVKNMANIALLIILISIIIERIKPENIFTFILISLAGLVSVIGFIILIKSEQIANRKNKRMSWSE